MTTRLIIATTLALGTTALTTGCDKANLMAAIGDKASALQGQLVDALGPRVQKLMNGSEDRAIRSPAGMEGGAWDMADLDTRGFDVPNLDTQGWDMPSVDAQNWELPSGDTQGWNMPDLDTQGWNMPNLDTQGWDAPRFDAQGWDAGQAQAFPGAMPNDDFQRRLAAQQQAFQLQQQQFQANSNRRFEAVQDWTKSVIRGE